MGLFPTSIFTVLFAVSRNRRLVSAWSEMI